MDTDNVDKCLVHTLERHDNIFRRLKTMGMSNVSLSLLTKCVNVRQQYQMRVHHPDATERVSERFDKNVEAVLESWLGKLRTQQVELARLPLKKGGLGLTACKPTREAAYKSSRYAVFGRQKPSTAQSGISGQMQASNEQQIPPEDEITTAAKLHEKAWQKLNQDPHMNSILKNTSRKGSYDWITAATRYVSPHVFSLSVMPRLGISHPKIPQNLLCPGCRKILDGRSALIHIPGCVQCPGFNATSKHNALVKYIYDLCIKTGIPCEREPRHFSTWTCLTCKRTVDQDNHQLHHKTCSGKNYHRSGPDIVIYWNTGAVFYDLTVIHDLAATHAKSHPGQLMKEATERKIETYVRSGMISEESFLCLPVLSSGSLHANTLNLIHELADASLTDRNNAILSFKLLLQELNGSQIYAELRKFLAVDTEASQKAI